FAMRENEKAAATFGVELTRYKLLSFAISGGMAALGGVVFVTYLEFAEATTWTTATSLIVVSMVMIGGIGSLSGSVLGAFLVIALPRLLHFDNPWIVPIGTGILLLIVIVRARGGLAGLVARLRHGLVEGLNALAVPPASPPGSRPASGAGVPRSAPREPASKSVKG
ncbi:MAG: ABC transporter permease subunit, partial [Acidimicrobiia bacterium]